MTWRQAEAPGGAWRRRFVFGSVLQNPGRGPIGRAQFEQVFLRAFTVLVPDEPTVEMARAATVQSARDLGGDVRVLDALQHAWVAAASQ